MARKQENTLRNQIADIKRRLVYEKRKFADYTDSHGMRYSPTKIYLKLQNYKGGLAYIKWFDENFSNDCGCPEFLFEWTVILFKTGNLKDAEKKAFETFCSNTYLLDKFLGRTIVPIDKYLYTNIDIPSFTDSFEYSSDQSNLVDFSDWLTKYLATENFIELSGNFIASDST